MPVEPEVVGVDYSRQLPANEGIYVGESARFLLVFYPEDFICNENDFTTTNEGVTVTMEEGGDNIVRISVADSVPVEETVGIYFREQLFMNVGIAAKPVPKIKVTKLTVSPSGEANPTNIRDFFSEEDLLGSEITFSTGVSSITRLDNDVIEWRKPSSPAITLRLPADNNFYGSNYTLVSIKVKGINYLFEEY